MASELGNHVAFPIGVIWNSWVPLKIDFFIREGRWNKILTLIIFEGDDGF